MLHTSVRLMNEGCSGLDQAFRQELLPLLPVALASSGIGLWKLDRDSGLWIWDETMAAMLGLGAASAFVPAPLRLHAEDEPSLGDRLARNAEGEGKGEGEGEVEFRVLSPAGEVIWLSAKAMPPAPASTGHVLLGTARDITNQGNTGTPLAAKSKAQRDLADWLAALDAMPQMAWSCDAAGGDEFYNRQWLHFTGVIVGRNEAPRLSLVHPDDRSRAEKAWSRCRVSGAPYELEYRLRHRSGDYRWVHSRALPSFDSRGAIERWHGCCTDIHDRVLAQARHREREQSFRRTLDFLPQIVWSMPETSARPDYYNQRWYELTGLPSGSTEGPEWAGLFHPEDQEPTLEAWRHSRMTGDPYQREYRIRDRHGDYRWTVSRGRLEADGSGERRWYGTCTDIHERVLARQALNESELRIKTILDSVPQIIWSADAGGSVDYLSAQWEKSYGNLDQFEQGDAWLRTLHPDDRRRAKSTWAGSVRSGDPYEIEYRVIGADGEYRWVLVRALRTRDENGRLTRWYGTCTDVHAHVTVRDALATSEALSRGIIDAIPDCVSLLDLEGTTIFVNEAAIRAYALVKEGNLLGIIWGSRFTGKIQARAQAAVRAAQGGNVGRLEVRDDTGRWWDVLVAPVLDSLGVPINLVVISRDVTQQKDVEEKIRWAANHDALTTIPNRSLLQDRLQSAIEGVKASGNQFALLLLDLDHFKQVNDTVGHNVGDAMLRFFAERVKGAIGSDDMVARLGGDEFAVILNRVDDETELGTSIEKIFAALREPFVHADRSFNCEASIGASLFPRDALDREQLMANADVALYNAKAGGRRTWRLFRPEMRSDLQRQFSMIHLAKDALRQKRVSPFYQPKVDLQTGSVAGFEALLRWKHPRRGVQLPQTIAAAFEDLSVASEISDTIVDQVIADLARWAQEGCEVGHVAINAAAAEFRRGDFAERLLERLAAASVPARCLQVEVTETVFLGRGSEAVERDLGLLSAAGVKIALDDFGTGYASLSHLKKFPVDIIKIDRSFVRHLDEGSDDAAIVEAILNLGRSLGISTVAEGIETQQQHELLKRAGCRYGQGFLYSKAVEASAVPGLCEPGRMDLDFPCSEFEANRIPSRGRRFREGEGGDPQRSRRA